MSSEPSDGDLLDGRYRLGAVLGRGGMAVVRRAVDERLGRTVAIKLYPGASLGDAARRQAEARSLAALTDPALVTLFDARLDAEPAYLVMECVDGEDLAARLSHEPLSPAETADLLGAIGGALTVAHGVGMVHRDVKPGNILIPAAGDVARARLADFGIARLVDSEALTTTGSVIGTAAYLAPEQLGGDAVTPAADVYALGLVAAEALTGVRPFPGSGAEAALARLQRAPELPSWIPADWRALIEGMTRREPSERPTARDVADAATGLDRAPVAPDPTTPIDTTRPATGPTAILPGAMPDAPTRVMTAPSPGQESGRRPVRRRSLLVAGGVAVLALLVGVAAALAVPATRPTAASGSPTARPTASSSPSATPTTAAVVDTGLSTRVRSALAALDAAIRGQHLDDLRDRLVAAIRSGDTSSAAAVLDALDAASVDSSDTASAIEAATGQVRGALGITATGATGTQPTTPSQAPAPSTPGNGAANGPGKGAGSGPGKGSGSGPGSGGSGRKGP